MHFHVIVAATRTGGIGYKGSLPWSIPEDLMYFYRQTTTPTCYGQSNTIIMGYRTWCSLPKRPLPQRRNIVVTSHLIEGVETASSLENALAIAQGKIFVIGGGQLFATALTHPRCRKVYLTQIENEIECDVFLPERWMDAFTLKHQSSPLSHNEYRYSFTVHRRIPHPEETYLDLVRKILAEGIDSSDRTGTGTRSLFGTTLRFQISEFFPLLTTKRVFWRGVVCELLFFLRGQTCSSILDAQGVKIWNAHGSKAYLRSRGIDREEGDLGPIYGYQWRHWGATYPDRVGIDQLRQVIHDLKHDPYSRRHIVSAWNVADLPSMALPPCHLLFQFYVREGKLSCQVYQRSADIGLGLPFNIASYSLLTYMIAHVTGLIPGEVILVLGDAHIYHSHLSALREQIARAPYTWPKVKLNSRCVDIDDFELDDIILEGYQAHNSLQMTMAV